MAARRKLFRLLRLIGPGRLWSLLLVVLCGDPVGGREAGAPLDNPISAIERLDKIRVDLLKYAGQLREEPTKLLLAQWFNFPNYWPNWNNWVNWPNWGNFWRNY